MITDTQNPDKNLPGFYFCPQKTDGLVTLAMEERVLIAQRRGFYALQIPSPVITTMAEMTDLLCLLDNARIPTHRQLGTTLEAAFAHARSMFEQNLTKVGEKTEKKPEKKKPGKKEPRSRRQDDQPIENFQRVRGGNYITWTKAGFKKALKHWGGTGNETFKHGPLKFPAVVRFTKTQCDGKETVECCCMYIEDLEKILDINEAHYNRIKERKANEQPSTVTAVKHHPV